ncbi:MAG: homogentisate 1,2-dioxygenase, partial [Flavobacteriales bacterium]|nr:homogentisate 1,2-dioxygenase [Flavobacteriales bacterium]
MPFYHHLGKIPHKRHTQFRKEDGSLYHEQLFGTIGFDGMSTLLYHIHPPTRVKDVVSSINVAPEVAVDHNMLSRNLNGFKVPPKADYLESRVPVLMNSDCVISLAATSASLTDYFYKNADSDEVVFIHEGSGTLKTQLGNIDFKYGDYLVIPRGMIHQF